MFLHIRRVFLPRVNNIVAGIGPVVSCSFVSAEPLCGVVLVVFLASGRERGATRI